MQPVLPNKFSKDLDNNKQREKYLTFISVFSLITSVKVLSVHPNHNLKSLSANTSSKNFIL